MFNSIQLYYEWDGVMLRSDLLVWFDGEMTGLDPLVDQFLEVACVITDARLNTIAEFGPLVIGCCADKLACMNSWCKEYHEKSGLIKESQVSKTTIQDAQEELLAFIKQYCESKSSPLCGNTIFQDRVFMKQYLPAVDDFLHYRLVDVSTIKELVKRWYTGDPKAKYIKKEVHRALPDIHASIAELKHYRMNFFVR
jgi:oligoribonuclease